MVGALLIAAPATANAATDHGSWAQGQFLSGSLAGMSLDSFASLTPATARNSGRQSTQEVVDPLSVSLLGSAPLTVGSTRVSPDAIVDTATKGGVLSQYAMAAPDGSALGASGTVGSGGAIGPNASHPAGAMTLSLDRLLGDRYAAAVTDLALRLQAVAAQATGSPSTVAGDYYLDGLTLTFTSPAIAKVASLATAAASAADAKLDALGGKDGRLGIALKGFLLAANPALDLGANADVSVVITHDLRAVVTSLLGKSWGGSGVSIDLKTGKVALDLETLIGGDLNNLPVNTELLSPAVVSRVISTITGQLDEFTRQLTTRLDQSLRSVRLDVDADLKLLTEQAPVIGKICQYEDSNGNILGELVGKLLGTLVCTTTSTALPKLETSASVDVHGTLGQVLDGISPATVTAKVLGVPLTMSSAKLLSALGGVLGDRVFGTSGILGGITAALDGPLLAQANTGLLGSVGLTGILSDILSLRVNLQETTLGGGGLGVATNTVFTQTALRVAVARGAGDSGLTTLNVAAASVAPVVTAGSGGPGTPGDPDGGSGAGGDGGGNTPAGDIGDGGVHTGNLAFTGVSLAIIVGVLIALLTLGAWLAREGHRRNHPTLEP
nr:choice-of-anchor G family protein [Terrimesophilobacter mesophilus]